MKRMQKMNYLQYLTLILIPTFGWSNTTLEIQKVFGASPIIYGTLFSLSIFAMTIWLYSLITFREKQLVSDQFVEELEKLLISEEIDRAKDLCIQTKSPLSSIVLAGIETRNLGAQVMIDSMKTEGKRISTPFWQRLSLLNDIAIISPMLGLLGTVIGMFYAFYDVNRSVESINALFDGLGIAVGTTVLGLIVAIISMLFSTTLKYRFIKVFSLIETKSLHLSTKISTSNKKEESVWN